MARRHEDDEIELIEEGDEQRAAADEIPFDPWGDEEDPAERRRDPLRGPAARNPDLA